MNKIKITVVGSGFVGMSIAVLLSQHNKVVVLDIDSEKVQKINNKQTTINDNEIENFLIEKELNLSATLDKHAAYKDASFVVVATPTNYDPQTNCFDTSSVDKVIKDALNANSNAFIVIRSTVPVGYTQSLQKIHRTDRIFFAPEFLREGHALKDNLYPSRIIVGSKKNEGKEFARLLANGALKKNVKKLYIESTEAEAIKLFANTYLAMRVSFFNELDSFALAHDLDTKSIIDGVCLDKRIGKGYNNPSFGYGGYCLPKDTKQLLANFDDLPQTLIKAIVSSNATRKDFIAKEILKLNPKSVGFFRLIMKEGSFNFRSSAIQGIINRIKALGVDTYIYEPQIDSDLFFGSKVISDLSNFKDTCDIILTNRMDNCLEDVSYKCFSRDIYGYN